MSLIVPRRNFTVTPRVGSIAGTAPVHPGLVDCCIDVFITVCLAQYTTKPLQVYDPSNTPVFSGLVVDVVSIMSSEMGFRYNVIGINNTLYSSYGPQLFEDTECDMFTYDLSYVAGLTDWHERVALSAPFLHVPSAGIVNLTRVSPGNPLFAPFSDGMWVAIGMTLVTAAGLLVAVDVIWPSSPPSASNASLSRAARRRRDARQRAIQAVRSTYDTALLCLGGDASQEWSTMPTKVIQLALLLVVLVLVSTCEPGRRPNRRLSLQLCHFPSSDRTDGSVNLAYHSCMRAPALPRAHVGRHGKPRSLLQPASPHPRGAAQY